MLELWLDPCKKFVDVVQSVKREIQRKLQPLMLLLLMRQIFVAEDEARECLVVPEASAYLVNPVHHCVIIEQRVVEHVTNVVSDVAVKNVDCLAFLSFVDFPLIPDEYCYEVRVFRKENWDNDVLFRIHCVKR